MRVRTQPTTTARRRIGFLRPGHIEVAFLIALYVALGILVLLSFLGTFYGLLGRDVPLTRPLAAWHDVVRATGVFGLACGIQFGLTLAQYGARQFARRDPSWWLLYLASLGVSVYYNIQAYWTPLIAFGLSWWVVLAIIILGDVIPEIVAVRHT